MQYRTPYGNSTVKYKPNHTFKKKKDRGFKLNYNRADSKREIQRFIAFGY